MNEHIPQTDFLLKRLQSFGFLRGLDEATLRSLANASSWKVYPPNAVVFWEGDVEANLFYLQYGLLKVLKSSPDGREQVLKFIEAGEIFNEVGVLAKRPNPATVIALEEILLAHPLCRLTIKPSNKKPNANGANGF